MIWHLPLVLDLKFTPQQTCTSSKCKRNKVGYGFSVVLAAHAAAQDGARHTQYLIIIMRSERLRTRIQAQYNKHAHTHTIQMQAVSLHMLSNGKYSVIKVSNCSKRFVRTAATVLIRRAELGSFPDTDNRGTEPNSNLLHNSLCSYCRLVDKHSNQHASCSCACWFADDHQFQHVSLVCCG